METIAVEQMDIEARMAALETAFAWLFARVAQGPGALATLERDFAAFADAHGMALAARGMKHSGQLGMLTVAIASALTNLVQEIAAHRP